MKYTVLTWLCLASLSVLAQAPSLHDYNQQRLSSTRTGMLVLGGWGTANLLGAGILATSLEGEARHFHQMNAAWGGINLGIAALSFFSAKKTDPGSFDSYQTIEEQFKTEKLFLFNAGVDLAYVTAGLWMADRGGRSDNPQRWKGFGKSIAVQGAFLFVFDLANYFVHASHRKQMKPIVQGLGFTGNGVHWVWGF